MLSRLIIAIAFLVVISNVAFCQSDPIQPDTSFEKAEKVQSGESEYYKFDLAGYHYKITSDGKGIRSKPQSSDQHFDLNLLKKLYERIDPVLYFAYYKGDLLLVAEVELDDAGSGILRRLDGESLKIKWEQRMKVFNIGPTLTSGDYSYLTGIGFVGKINLITSKYEWRHENLYRKDSGSYNSFALPSIVKKRIIFKESYGAAAIEVDDKTGKILRMDK